MKADIKTIIAELEEREGIYDVTDPLVQQERPEEDAEEMVEEVYTKEEDLLDLSALREKKRMIDDPSSGGNQVQVEEPVVSRFPNHRPACPNVEKVTFWKDPLKEVSHDWQ